jgi:hypothetical protein
VLNSLTYVIAPAYNDVDIVLMAFPTVEDAHAHLSGLGLVRSEHNENAYGQATIDGKVVPLSEALDMAGEATQTLRKSLFQNGNYYGGCGECHYLYVREVPVGQPVVAFNLD